ncbi:MAG: AMP-binding protein [Myxococcales bacterium]|nr:AMP-binding protein [Myxococcales bacterium]
MADPVRAQPRVARDPRTDAFLVDNALRVFGRERPDHPALVFGSRRIGYAELDSLVDRAARHMRARGVTRQSRVLVALENSVACVLAFYGALRADAIPSLVGGALRPQRRARLLSLAEPSLVVDDEATFEEEVARTDAGPGERASIDADLATICWTSGSLGEPKGVMLSYANLRNSSLAIGSYLDHGPEDVILCVLPLSHTYGLFQMLVTHMFGGTLVLERGYGMPFPIVERLMQEKVTGFAGVPTIFASLLSLKKLGTYDLTSLRYLTNAAYALPAAQVARLHEHLPKVRFYAMYGQTECTRVCYLPPEEAESLAGSVGISMPNQEAWLEREDGSRAEVGEVGELVIRGGNVMRGYFRDPEATARTLRPGPTPGELVLHTNDLFRLDERGYLTFVSRKDDVIKTRGEKISPVEVEGIIAELEGVREVAVVGVPDPTLGTAVKAFLVLADGASVSADDVRRHVREHLGEVAVPKQLEVIAELPRTASGKVRKGDLL